MGLCYHAAGSPDLGGYAVTKEWSRHPLVLGFALVVGVGLVYLLRDTLLVLLFALLLAYILNPAVCRLTRLGLPRALAIGVLLFGVLLTLALAVTVIIPMVSLEIQIFTQNLPGLFVSLDNNLSPYLERYAGMGLADSLEQVGAQISEKLGKLDSSTLSPVSVVLGTAFSGTMAAIKALSSLALILLFTIYFLADFDALVRSPLALIPPRHRDKVADLGREIDEVLSGFVRGQLTVCLALGLLYGIGYSFAQVPLGLLIGLVAGALSFLPYIGAGLGLILALIMSLLDWQGWGVPAGALGAYVAVQILDTVLVTPRIMGSKVGLSPLVVMLALLVGGQLLGFAGVLLSLPAAAVCKILVQRLVRLYQGGDFFTGNGCAG